MYSGKDSKEEETFVPHVIIFWWSFGQGSKNGNKKVRVALRHPHGIWTGSTQLKGF